MKRNLLYFINRQCLLALFITALALDCDAQDPRFSQFFVSPMTLNPAMIGKGVADWRALTNYRSQWFGAGISPFNTATISFEKNFTRPNGGGFSTGLLFLNETSNNGILKTNYAAAGLSYTNVWDTEGKNMISIGFNGSYATRLLDMNKFLFQSQFGSNGFQSSINSNEDLSGSSHSYFDVDAGLHYSYTGKHNGYYLGASYFHLARPKDGLYANSPSTVDPRFSTQAGYYHIYPSGHSVHFSGLYEHQSTSNSYTAGMLLKLAMTETNLNVRSINTGIWDRFGDAVIPYIGIEFNRNWLLGFSYDVITSGVTATLNSLQTVEMSFSWQFAAKKKAAKLTATKQVIVY